MWTSVVCGSVVMVTGALVRMVDNNATVSIMLMIMLMAVKCQAAGAFLTE